MEHCRPNPEWETCYNPVSDIQVHKLEWTLDQLLIFPPNSDATKNMDNFPSDNHMSRTIDAALILFEAKDLVPVELAGQVQSNRKLLPKTPSLGNSNTCLTTEKYVF